jgi:hypothetical protein
MVVKKAIEAKSKGGRMGIFLGGFLQKIPTQASNLKFV